MQDTPNLPYSESDEVLNALYAFLKREAGYSTSLFLNNIRHTGLSLLKGRAVFSEFVSKSVVDEKSYNISCPIPGKDEDNSRLNRFRVKGDV